MAGKRSNKKLAYDIVHTVEFSRNGYARVIRVSTMSLGATFLSCTKFLCFATWRLISLSVAFTLTVWLLEHPGHLALAAPFGAT